MTVPKPAESFVEKLEDTLGIPHGKPEPGPVIPAAKPDAETSPVPIASDTPAPLPTVQDLESQIDALTHRVLLLESVVQKLVFINRKDMPSE